MELQRVWEMVAAAAAVVGATAAEGVVVEFVAVAEVVVAEFAVVEFAVAEFAAAVVGPAGVGELIGALAELELVGVAVAVGERDSSWVVAVVGARTAAEGVVGPSGVRWGSC